MDIEPENWEVSLKDLKTTLSCLEAKLNAIKMKEIELRRLEALLEKAGIESENGKSAIVIYEEALEVSPDGYKIVHKRDISEIYVNNYNSEWLIIWNANMDLQLCLDFFAVITYISDYWGKDDSGTMGYIKEALQSAENESLKNKLSLVINQFLTHRQIGECEAYFKILPHLHLKWSNIETVYVPTGFKCNRSQFLKEVSPEEAKYCEDIIRIENKKGLFIEKPSMIDKFERLDCDQNEHINELRYLQFCMKYISSNAEPKKNS